MPHDMDRGRRSFELGENRFDYAAVDEITNLPKRRKADADPLRDRGVCAHRIVGAKAPVHLDGREPAIDAERPDITRPIARSHNTVVMGEILRMLG